MNPITIDLAASNNPLYEHMDSSSSPQSDNPKPKQLRALAYNVKFPGRNTLLHQFVIDNSDPDESGSENYMNAVLMSMYDAPASLVNALNDDGYSALHLAVLQKNLKMVEKLLSCLLNVHVNTRCRTLFLFISRQSRKRRYTENSALHIAAQSGHLSIIQELLRKGADIDIKNNWYETALFIAIRSGHLDVMKMLVSKGANVNLRCGMSSPLCLAVSLRNLEVAEFLVSSGADVNFADGFITLWYATRSGSLALVELLVNNGADVNIKIRYGETALHHAARSASLEIVEYLVSKGADLHSKEGKGKTPLHEAVTWRKSENAAFLLDRGADMHARDVLGRTPLHDAVLGNNLECAAILLDRGADINAEDYSGRTPLHEAVRENNSECAALLFDYGADFREDKLGWTPLHFAACIGYVDSMRALLDKGADVNVRNKDGKIPLDLAKEKGNRSCIDALQNLR